MAAPTTSPTVTWTIRAPEEDELSTVLREHAELEPVDVWVGRGVEGRFAEPEALGVHGGDWRWCKRYASGGAAPAAQRRATPVHACKIMQRGWSDGPGWSRPPEGTPHASRGTAATAQRRATPVQACKISERD